MDIGIIVGIIGIALTIIFGIAGLIIGGTKIRKHKANSKIGHHSNNNTVNQNIEINKK